MAVEPYFFRSSVSAGRSALRPGQMVRHGPSESLVRPSGASERQALLTRKTDRIVRVRIRSRPEVCSVPM